MTRSLEGARLQTLAALYALHGQYVRIAPGTARLFVGRGLNSDMRTLARAGWRPGGQDKPLGHALSRLELFVRRMRVSRIVREALSVRTEQLGSAWLAGATSQHVCQGGREPTVEIWINFAQIKSKEAHFFPTFKDHVMAVGERLCYALAQKEIAITFADPEGRLSAFGASPVGFPGPDEAHFDKFIENEIKQTKVKTKKQ